MSALPDIRGANSANAPAEHDDYSFPESDQADGAEAEDELSELPVTNNNNNTGGDGESSSTFEVHHRNPMLPAPREKKKRQSIMGESYLKKNQYSVKGHSNVHEAAKRVKRFSEVARAENHLELEHIKSFHDTWKLKGGSLSEEDFYRTFKQTLGDKWDPKKMHEVCHYLFTMMDTNRDLAVDWSEFCQYIAKGLAEKEIVDHEQENPVMMCAAKFPSKHLGRIVRLEALSSPTRFVSICEDAIACFWSSKMAITQVTHMDSAAFISPRASLRVTDGCYMPNASTIVICTNARDMRFHHALTGQMTHKMLLPEIVLTMTLHIDETKPDKATLAYGDFKGNVTAIEFYKATEALFEPPKVSKTSGFKSRTDSHGRRRPPDVVQFQQSDLPRFDHGKQRDKYKIERIHSTNSKSTARHSIFHIESKVARKQKPHEVFTADPHCKCDIATLHYPEGDGLNEGSVAIEIVPALTLVVSIAATDKNSMVVYDYHLGSKKSFSISHGIQGFAIDTTRHLIATGGRDTILRFWNPHVPGVPVAELAGHVSPITHVVSNSSRGQMISVDKNEIIKIWHITDQSCLNTFVGVIPHSLRYVSNDAAVSSIHALKWHEPSQTLMACSFVEVSCVEIQRGVVQAADIGMDTSICSILYVPHFNLLMSGDLNGSIASFDMTTGERVLEYINGHMHAAVTALAVSANGQRCISGASDGDIYVWNILSGTVLQKLNRGRRKEITGLFSCMGDKAFATGWGGKLSCFYIGDEVDLKRCPVSINELPFWGPIQEDTSDVHTCSAVGETMMCTGADNGNIVVWDLRAGKQSRVLNIKAYMAKNTFQEDDVEADEDGYVHKVKSMGTSGSGASSKKFPRHMPSNGAIAQAMTRKGAAVRSISWLKRRIKESVQEGKGRAATLVVGYDGGFVCMWNVVHEEIFGGFYATDDIFGTASVNAIAADSKNDTMFTADSMGWVKQWDISRYCQTGEDNKKPQMCSAWQAHHQPITAMMVHEESNFIITASEDCAIRVWKLTSGHSSKGVGHYIGSFGTDSSWHVPIEGRLSLSAKLINPAYAEDEHETRRDVRAIDEITKKIQSGSKAEPMARKSLKTTAKDIKESLIAHGEVNYSEGAELEHVVNAALAVDQFTKPNGSDSSNAEGANDDDVVDLPNFGDDTASDVNRLLSPVPTGEVMPRRSTAFAIDSMLTNINAKAEEDARLDAFKTASDPADDVRAFRASRASAAKFGLGRVSERKKKGRPHTAPLQLAQETIDQYKAKPTRLGSAYGKRQRKWAADRVDARQTMAARPLISDQDPVALGLTICTPFTALHLQPETTIVSIKKVPSFVRRSSMATEAAFGRGRNGGISGRGGKRGLVPLPKSGTSASPALARMDDLKLPDSPNLPKLTISAM